MIINIQEAFGASEKRVYESHYLDTGFKWRKYVWIMNGCQRFLCSFFYLVLCFIPCIQMNAYFNDHCPEGKMFIALDLKIRRVVVIQDTVIYSFTGGVFTVNSFVFFTAAWDLGIKPQV